MSDGKRFTGWNELGLSGGKMTVELDASQHFLAAQGGKRHRPGIICPWEASPACPTVPSAFALALPEGISRVWPVPSTGGTIWSPLACWEEQGSGSEEERKLLVLVSSPCPCNGHLQGRALAHMQTHACTWAKVILDTAWVTPMCQ